jgi:integrase
MERTQTIETEAPDLEPEPEKKRAKKHTLFLTEANVKTLSLPKESQEATWDTKQTGLSILCSRTTRTYRATYTISYKKNHERSGKIITTKIGRVGEMSLGDARKMVETYRGIANEGDDPVKPKPRKMTFGELAEDFVRLYCKPNQRTWPQTERILRVNCTPLSKRPIDMLTKGEIKKLCNEFASAGHPYKATNTHAIIKVMLGWAEEEGLVKTNVMQGATSQYECRERDRFYSEEEIKAIWNAADQLGPVEGPYVKLLLLLAPRKTALAAMKRNHLNAQMTVWTTPHELTKSKKRKRKVAQKPRTYVTPLPALAQRLLKGLPKGNSGEYAMFPGLAMSTNRAGQLVFNSLGMIERLKQNGAPNFMPHAVRHTIATWFEDQGCSEWERGLVLNHAGTGVTAGYSHGFAGKLKLELLEKWAAHVEQLVRPAQGVTVLR